MSDPVISIANALGRERGGIAIVYYPDLGLRDWIVEQVASVARPSSDPLRVKTVDEAIKVHDRLMLLIPEHERETVEALSGSRDRIMVPPREHPIVLFLLRDGEGQRALALNPSLASFVRGSDPDPELLAQVDPAQEREAFQREAGCTPREWLDRHPDESGQVDSRRAWLSYWAMLLEGR